MKFTDNVPTSFRWIMRILGWSVALMLIIPAFRAGTVVTSLGAVEDCSTGAEFKTGQGSDSLYSAQRLSLCMFLKSSYLESRRLEPVLLDVMSLPNAPCERVGIWKSARRQSVYEVTLRDDGTFSGTEVADFTSTYDSGDSAGYWGEHEGKMIWIYHSGVIWPPDINRIESQSPDKFTLIEVNGERTEFTRQRRLDSDRCPGA